MRRLSIALCATLALVPACSYCFSTTYRVTVAEDVDVPPDTAIVMGHAEVDDVAAALAVVESTRLRDDGRLEAEGPPDAHDETPMYLFAFVDLDGDGAWTEGEPWGADPNNPVTHDCSQYYAYIDIESAE